MKPLIHLLGQTLHRLWLAAGTKYFLVLIVAGIYMLWWDRYNLHSQQQVKEQIEQLKADRNHYRHAIDALEYEAEQIRHDRETLERFGRERYYMKRTNEDVYVVVEE